MLSIRLSRTGKKHKPYFRIIVLDKKKDPWGDFLENLGNYNPRTKELVINADRIKFWIEKGAQPSKTVHNILVSQEIVKDKKVGVSRISKKRKAKLAEKEKSAKKSGEEKPVETKVETPKKEEKTTNTTEKKPTEETK